MDKLVENYYFYEEDQDERAFLVYYGNAESDFKAAYIGEFANEDDACEYVDWKNELLAKDTDSFLDDNFPATDDEVLDADYDESERDVVDEFMRNERWER